MPSSSEQMELTRTLTMNRAGQPVAHGLEGWLYLEISSLEKKGVPGKAAKRRTSIQNMGSEDDYESEEDPKQKKTFKAAYTPPGTRVEASVR